jgi:predicted permease
LQDLSHVNATAVTGRALIMLLVAFIVCFATAKIIGKENKERWFKKRTNYTMLNRRGIFGEYINFRLSAYLDGDMLVTFIMFVIIFGGGFVYLFLCSLLIFQKK